MSTRGTADERRGSSTIGAPCSHAAVRSVTTACSGTTRRRHASRSSRLSASCAACRTPWTARRGARHARHARSRRGSTPWARAQLVVNGRSIGTGAAEVRKERQAMSMAPGCPVPPYSTHRLDSPCGQPRSAESSCADSARFRCPLRRLGVFGASLRRLGVSGGRSLGVRREGLVPVAVAVVEGHVHGRSRCTRRRRRSASGRRASRRSRCSCRCSRGETFAWPWEATDHGAACRNSPE